MRGKRLDLELKVPAKMFFCTLVFIFSASSNNSRYCDVDGAGSGGDIVVVAVVVAAKVVTSIVGRSSSCSVTAVTVLAAAPTVQTSHFFPCSLKKTKKRITLALKIYMK